MKKTILLCGALLALTASVAAAEGVNFSWTDCYGDGGVQNKNFACTANTGAAHAAVGSYVAPAGVGGLTGNEVVIDLQSQGAALPAWWQFKNAGTCRTTSQAMNFTAPVSLASCVDYWSGQAAGGIGAYNIGFGGNPARARIVAAIAVPASAVGPVDADVEYFSFNLTMNNAKTVGTGACAGCSIPVCLVLNSIKLTQGVGIGDFKLSAPGNGIDSNYITWQGGNIGGSGCPAATPAKNATWGTVKSLYR